MPGSDVRQHNRIDLDQKEIEAALKASPANFRLAMKHYTVGGNSLKGDPTPAPPASGTVNQGHSRLEHSDEKQQCSCAQAEPDHPFTIDCNNAAAIRAATTTLETTCTANNAGYEWGGAFATPDNAYKWVAQAKGGAYVDPSMKLVVFDVHAADKEHLLELAETAKSLIAGTCTAVNTQGTIPAPTEAGACYTLTFPADAATDFHATIATTGVANVAFFAEHVPTEFERDMHYFMSADLATNIEPAAETDPEEYNCRLSLSTGTYLPTYLPTCQPIYTYRPIYLLSTYESTHLSAHPSAGFTRTPTRSRSARKRSSSSSRTTTTALTTPSRPTRRSSSTIGRASATDAASSVGTILLSTLAQ